MLIVYIIGVAFWTVTGICTLISILGVIPDVPPEARLFLIGTLIVAAISYGVFRVQAKNPASSSFYIRIRTKVVRHSAVLSAGFALIWYVMASYVCVGTSEAVGFTLAPGSHPLLCFGACSMIFFPTLFSVAIGRIVIGKDGHWDIKATFLTRWWLKASQMPLTSREEVVNSNPKLVSYAEALIEVEGKKDKSEKIPAPTIAWAHLDLPLGEGSGNFLVAGAPGSGKTVQLQLLIQSLFRLMRRCLNQRAFIFDGKREFLPILFGIKRALRIDIPIHILNPFDARSTAWDIAKDVRTPAQAAQVAATLVPRQHSGEPFFANATRALLYGMIIALQEISSGEWTLRDVLLLFRSKDRLFRVLQHSQETREIRDSFLEPKTLNNILSEAATRLSPFSIVAALWDTSDKTQQKFTIKKWLDEESVAVFGLNPVHSEAMRPINQVLFQQLSNALLDHGVNEALADKRTWLILDELREAGRLDGLSSLLNQGRSRNVSIALGFQDIVGLKVVYKEEALEIVGQCRNKSFLPTSSSETAKWIQMHFDNAYAEEHSTSYSYSTGRSGGQSNYSHTHGSSRQRNIRPIVLASELLALKPPTEETGFSGFHDLPAFKSFFVRMPWMDVITKLCPIAKDEPGEIKRPLSDQILRPWDAADEKRLKLLPLDNTETKQAEKKGEIPDLLTGIG